MKIKNLKQSIGDYKRVNKGGIYSPRYGYLMFNQSTGELWTDEFYDYGHNWWTHYHDLAIVNLGHLMGEQGLEVSMKNVKAFIQENFKSEV